LPGQVLIDINPICFSIHDRFGNLLPICLVSSIVFDLDVQVKRAFRGVRLGALGIWAG